MSSYKPNINELRGELYYNHQTVVVSFYIEHISLIADIINTVKGAFHVSQ